MSTFTDSDLHVFSLTKGETAFIYHVPLRHPYLIVHTFNNMSYDYTNLFQCKHIVTMSFTHLKLSRFKNLLHLI